MPNHRIQRIENYVKQTMSTVAVGDLKLAHDFKHVDRVRGWALKIAKNEGYEALALVEATALLHDIGLAHVEQRHHHARVGAEIATGFLTKHSLFTDKEIAMVAEAIRCHSSMRGGGTLGEILRDADMLEMLGAVGIMRALTSKYAKPEYDPGNIKGETWGMTANNFTERFRNGTGVGNTIVDQINFQISCYQNLNTASARQMARPLIEFMKTYLIQLECEIKATQGQSAA